MAENCGDGAGGFQPGNTCAGQKRAAAGGETGPNGEWYPGGAFIATTEMPKMQRAKLQRAASGRKQIEPGKYEVPPPGELAIYDMLRPGVLLDSQNMRLNLGAAEHLKLDESARAQYADLLSRYKAGERFVDGREHPALLYYADMQALAFHGATVPGEALQRMAKVRSTTPEALEKELGLKRFKGKGETKLSAAMPTPVTLTAETPAAVPVVTLGSGLPTEKDGHPVFYRRRTAAYARDYDLTHPGTREKFNISVDRLNKAVTTFKRRAAKGILPYLTPYHVDPHKEPDARDTLGYVVGLERKGEDLVADLQLIGDDALKTSTRNRVSICMLPDGVDADGDTYENVLHHIAFSPNEALHGMGDHMPIAASAAGPPIEIKAYTLCAASTPAEAGRIDDMLPKETLAKLRTRFKLADTAPDADVYTKAAEAALADPPPDKTAEVTALSAQVATLTGERDTAKQEAETLRLSATPRQPDDLSLALITRSFKTDRARVIESGVISEAGMTELDNLLLPGGKPGGMALALSAGSHDPLYTRVCEILMKHPGLKLNAAVDRVPAQLPPLSGAAATDSQKAMDDARAEAAKWQAGQAAARGLVPVG